MIRIIRHEVNIYFIQEPLPGYLRIQMILMFYNLAYAFTHVRYILHPTYNLFYFSVKYTICFKAFLNINLLN